MTGRAKSWASVLLVGLASIVAGQTTVTVASDDSAMNYGSGILRSTQCGGFLWWNSTIGSISLQFYGTSVTANLITRSSLLYGSGTMTVDNVPQTFKVDGQAWENCQMITSTVGSLDPTKQHTVTLTQDTAQYVLLHSFTYLSVPSAVSTPVVSGTRSGAGYSSTGEPTQTGAVTKGSSSMGGIIGGVVAGILVLGLIIALIIILRRRSKNKQSANTNNTYHNAPPAAPAAPAPAFVGGDSFIKPAATGTTAVGGYGYSNTANMPTVEYGYSKPEENSATALLSPATSQYPQSLPDTAYGQPGYGVPQPGYGPQQPAYGGQQPVYGQPGFVQPGYGQPQYGPTPGVGVPYPGSGYAGSDTGTAPYGATSQPPTSAYPSNAQIYGAPGVAAGGYARSDTGSEPPAPQSAYGGAPQSAYGGGGGQSGLTTPADPNAQNRFSAAHVTAIHSMMNQNASPEHVAAMLNSMGASGSGPSGPSGGPSGGQGPSVQGGSSATGVSHAAMPMTVQNANADYEEGPPQYDFTAPGPAGPEKGPR